MPTHLIVGVIGGGRCTKAVAQLAEEVGAAIARRGAWLLCGGLGGVMEAACRGAKQAGGFTIGVIPGSDRGDANAFVDLPIVTGMSHARNLIIVHTADVLIAVDGSYGTLSEIAFALHFAKPVIALHSWEVVPKLIRAETPTQAVELAFQALQSPRAI
jgi:hypothetical protein